MTSKSLSSMRSRCGRRDRWFSGARNAAPTQEFPSTAFWTASQVTILPLPGTSFRRERRSARAVGGTSTNRRSWNSSLHWKRATSTTDWLGTALLPVLRSGKRAALGTHGPTAAAPAILPDLEAAIDSRDSGMAASCSLSDVEKRHVCGRQQTDDPPDFRFLQRATL